MSVPTSIELRDHAIRVAEEAAVAVRRERAAGIGTVSAKSSATDPVTEIDRSTEALIVERLLEVRPQDSILGEEAGTREGSSPVRWVIDPIDGTVNFVYGIPAYAVSIGVEVDGQRVAGAVVDVVGEITYAAAAAAGATGAGQPLAVSTVHDPAAALIGTGFGYRPERRRLQARILADVLPQVRDIRRIGSAALDLCSVAAGRLDGYFELGLGPWDLAAGAVMVQEAGGVVRQMPAVGDDDLVTIAAGPGLLDQLIDLLRRAEAIA